MLLFHLHRYGVELAVSPPDWLPVARVVRDHAAWLLPGMWATFLLVGLAAYRVAEGVPSLPVSAPSRFES